MESGSRRRGCSFHEEYEDSGQNKTTNRRMSGGSYKSQLEVSMDMQTPFEFTDDFDEFDDIPHISGNSRGNIEGDDEEEDFAPRGRSRSQSLNEEDELHLSAPSQCDRGTERTAPILATSPSKSAPILISIPVGNKSSSDRASSLERTGPLHIKEIVALQKGLHEAEIAARSSLEEVRCLHLNDTELELERIDAELERAERLSGLSGSFPGSPRSPGSLSLSSSPGSPLGPSSQSTDKNLRRIKLLMLGDSGVGKSSLMLRWTMDRYRTSLISTVGVNFKNKRTLIEGETVIVQVWDTAGQLEFHNITKSYYKGANGIMLLYDVSDQKSFANVEYWIKSIKESAQENVNIVLVGNKSDLRVTNDENYVSFETGHNVASRYNVPFIETSAKDSKNVDNAFMYLAKATLGLEVPLPSHASARNSLLSKLLRSKSDEPRGNVASPSRSHASRSHSGSDLSSSRTSSISSNSSGGGGSGSGSGNSENSGSNDHDLSSVTSVSNSPTKKDSGKCIIS